MDTKSQRTIAWFSCGAASAVAAKLTPEAIPVYCETRAEHPDNERFLKDCEDWLGRKVQRIASDEYESTWDVWEKRKYIAGIDGAPCTTYLKVRPRLEFQRPDDVHVFGYTADKRDAARATALRQNYPELTVRSPLVDRGLTKEACIAMIERAGIRPPIMYDYGFHNNNCIPCVKATSPAYWANIRKHFPDEFDRICNLSRELGARLVRIDNERVFLDELPPGEPTINPIQPSCDFLCQIAEGDME